MATVILSRPPVLPQGNSLWEFLTTQLKSMAIPKPIGTGNERTRILRLVKPRWYAFFCTWRQETSHLRHKVECRWVFLRKSDVVTMKGKLVLSRERKNSVPHAGHYAPMVSPLSPHPQSCLPILSPVSPSPFPVLSPHPIPSPVSPSLVLSNRTCSVAEFLLLLRSSLLRVNTYTSPD